MSSALAQRAQPVATGTAEVVMTSETGVPALQFWSGGKDSAMALWTARQAGEFDVQALASTVAPKAERTTWHGVRTKLMERQAAAIGLPFIPIPAPNFDDLDGLLGAMAAFLRSPAAPYQAVIWGDLNWAPARTMHQQVSASAGKQDVYPLWDIGHDSAALARRVIAAGFKAIVTSVDTRVLSGAFAGRDYDAAFLADLPAGVDPCGEGGEFHTFVWDGPIFQWPVQVRRTRFAYYWPDVYCDLEPAD